MAPRQQIIVLRRTAPKRPSLSSSEPVDIRWTLSQRGLPGLAGWCWQPVLVIVGFKDADPHTLTALPLSGSAQSA
jgi:hypothetical protein